MKTLLVILLLALISFGFSSCLKDAELQKYTYYVPEFGSKSEVRANVKSAAPQSLVSPGKMYVQGNYIYINELGKGIHIIDYSQPSSPKNIAYIPIPGNVDISAKGNYLYADEYADLLTIDISDPEHAKLVNVVSNAIPEINSWTSDSSQIVVNWRRVDSTVKSGDDIINPPVPVFLTDANFGYSAQSAKSGSISTGGSTSRFAAVNNRLYTVSNSTLTVFTIDNAKAPAFVQTINTNLGGIETIYPLENNLFLGSTGGISIYNIDDEDNPQAEGAFGHYFACDPVIADDSTAYVTLRDGTACAGFTNELDVVNTSDLNRPVLLKTYPFTNPRGLAKEGDYLFICDGKEGLKILNAENNYGIVLLKTITGFEANDVILNNGLAIVTASNGLYFIDYHSIAGAHVVGSISISK